MRKKVTFNQFEEILDALFHLGYSGNLNDKEWDKTFFLGWLSVMGSEFGHCVISVNIDGGGSDIICWIVYNDEDEWSNEEVGGYIKGTIGKILPEMRCDESMSHDKTTIDIFYPEENTIEEP